MKGTGNVDFPRGKKMPKCFIVWMGGWMGGWVGGDFLPPSIFFIFKYHDKKLALVLKMYLKVAYGF